MSESTYKPLKRHLIVWWIWGAVIAAFIAAAIHGIVTVLGQEALFWTWFSFGATFLLFATFSTLYHRSLVYVLSDRHMSKSSGILWKRRRSIQLETITDIDVRQGPVERLLGFGQVWIFTHSTEHDLPEEKLLGVSAPDEIKKAIIEQAEQAVWQREQKSTCAEVLLVLRDIRDSLTRLEELASGRNLSAPSLPAVTPSPTAVVDAVENATNDPPDPDDNTDTHAS